MTNRTNRKQRDAERTAAVQAARAAQEAHDRRRRQLMIVGLALIVLVVAGGIWWQVSQSEVGVTADGPEVPSEQLADGIAVGEATEPVLDVYLDFLCSHCAELEERVGDTIDEMVEDGEIRLVVHPITLIDPTESAQSAAAIGCAAGTDSVLGLQAALFENAAGGFSNDRLVEIGQAAGITDDAYEQCVREGERTEWAAEVDRAATQRGVQGTPTIFLDGEPFDIQHTITPEDFRAAVLGSES